MMFRSKQLIVPLLLLFCLASCVPQKKYQASLVREQELLNRNAEQAAQLRQLRNSEDSLQDENAKLVSLIDDAMKKASEASGVANLTQKQLEEEQKRLWEMRKLMDQQKQAVENLRKKMADALTGFNSNELSIHVKNGRVYVSMQESLLFPSGSAAVNPKGKEALATLAQVLNTNSDINVVVEGHTDSIPIHGRYEDNWALSVARATSISRVLTADYGVDPLRVTASGKSQFDPIDSNSTPEGRAHNRRTEIILAPKLDELMQLLQQNPAASASTN